MNADTLEVLRRSAVIPSMPHVAARCYELTQDPLCSYESIVEAMSTDPGMAGDTLRLANSALFGVVRKVDSLKQAIALLGLKRIRDLVLTRYMIQSLEQIKTEPIDIDYFWRRSLTTAVVAGRLADAAAPRHRDEAFLGGLLSDIGVIILNQALPTKYAAIAEHYKPFGGDEWLQLEPHVLGATHGQVSAMVLEEWALPEPIVDAVRHHHAQPDTIPPDAPGRATAPIIGAAGTIAVCLCEALAPVKSAGRCLAALHEVGLDPAILVKALPNIEADVESLADILRVDVIPARAYTLIAEHIAAQLTAPVG